MKNLTILGSGIKSFSHLTQESITYIKNSEIICYLINEPLMKDYIRDNSKESYDLDILYNAHTYRKDSYLDITKYVLSQFDKYNHVSFIVYGHPCFCVNSTINAIKLANKDIDIEVLPAVSSEDCLYADLGINPLVYGTQIYEATDFLIFDRTVDASSNLILFQIGMIGNIKHDKDVNIDNLIILKSKLLNHYPKDHELIVYEASLYPHVKPVVTKITLNDLENGKFSHISTVFIKPSKENKINLEMLSKLGIERIIS